jgi:uncharacterized protein (DUF2235 family)
MKKVIFCADGTWNTPPGVHDKTGGGTNVWKLYCAMPDTPDQLKFYDSGVGTNGNTFDHLTGGALGDGLFQKIQDGYSYLSHVYDPGDPIYLFGFSRGAYTARSVGGMLAGFGLPSKNLSNSTTPEIFNAYRERDPAHRAELKKQLTQSYGLAPVKIAMVGVWDTVGSLGVPGFLFESFNDRKYGFLDTTLSDCVDHAYHAVSIDERRASFQPTLWTNKDGSYRKNDARVEQVWFTGGHCDVGGSYPACDLADITLSWMMRKAKAQGIEFLPDQEQKYFNLPTTRAAGQNHDEWNVLWGLEKHREVAPEAHLSNSVILRVVGGQPKYQPRNLTNLQVQNGAATGYSTCDVLPYSEPVWPEV